MAEGLVWRTASPVSRRQYPTVHRLTGAQPNTKGEPAQSNMQLIARARWVIAEYGCEPATSDETRQILNLK